MPKKKDKISVEKKDESKKAKKKESSVDKTNSDDSSSDKGKEFYLTQIRCLEQQLERYQHKCDELEVQRKDFGSRYDTLEKEKKDVVEYLKHAVVQREEELAEQEERLQALQSAALQERDNLQLQLGQLRQQLQERTDKLTAENMTLAGKLADLEEFRQQKERLLSDLESLEKQLADQKEEHSAAVYSLEKKALLENDRLKKEMHSHVAAVAAELRDLSEQKMPEATTQAMRENVAMRSRLGQLSEQIHVLLKENEALRSREKQLRLEVSILEPLLDQLACKSRSHQKVAEQLTEKCQQLQAELKDQSSAQQDHQQLESERTLHLAELDALRQDRASALEESSRSRAEAERRGAELQEERRRRRQLESRVQDAAFALTQALMEAPADEDLKGDAAVRWRQKLQQLLVVLDSDPDPTESDTETKHLEQPQSCSSTPTSRAETLDPGPGSGVRLPRYRPGDLGLVPRLTPRHNGTSKTGRLPSTRLLLHSRTSSQRTTGCSHPPPAAKPPTNSSYKPKRH